MTALAETTRARPDNAGAVTTSLRFPGRAALFLAGSAAAVPVMNFTVTGFSVVCAGVAGAYFLPSTRRRPWLPVVLAGLAVLAYAVSSIVNGTSLIAPNVLAYAAFALYFCGIAVLAEDIERTLTIIVGIGFGTVVFYVLFGTALTVSGQIADLWKYGVAPPVTLAVLYATAVWARGRLIAPLALCADAVLSLALNYRSHALICAAVALLLVLGMMFGGRLSSAIKAGIVLVFGVGFSALLQFAARDGILGTSLQEKVLMQSSEHVPSLLAGRSESPLSVNAIINRPLLGWGSANNISGAVYEQARRWAVELGFDSTYPFQYVWKLPNGSISLHSIIMVSWAEAGVVAVLLPVWLLAVCLVLVFASAKAGRWAPALMYLGLQGAWDLLFSPWTYNMPAVLAGVACAYIALGEITSRAKVRRFRSPS